MMFKSSHLSDDDLLRAADGEWPARRQREIRRHLQACWVCRGRMAEIERSIASFVECYSSALDLHLPADEASATYRLRRLMEAESSLPGNAGWIGWAEQFFRRRWTVAALPVALTLVIFGAGLLRERTSHLTMRQMVSDLEAKTVPNPNLTPGEATAASASDLCHTQAQNRDLKVPDALREAVFSAYGMKNVPRDAYEVDFLITPELGGSASLRNLWPEPYRNGAWNARTKDALEDRLHKLVCDGDVDLSTAQHEIATNWVSAYKKYVGTDHPM